MKREIEEIDELIKEALSKEEAKFYDELEELNLFEKIGGVFSGKLKWIVILMNVVNLIAVGLFVYCIVQFFSVDDTNELIKWSGAALFCVIIVSMLKLYVWMQMDKNDILRELKRLELQVASLMSRKNGQSGE